MDGFVDLLVDLLLGPKTQEASRHREVSVKWVTYGYQLVEACVVVIPSKVKGHLSPYAGFDNFAPLK